LDQSTAAVAAVGKYDASESAEVEKAVDKVTRRCPYWSASGETVAAQGQP